MKYYNTHEKENNLTSIYKNIKQQTRKFENNVNGKKIRNA